MADFVDGVTGAMPPPELEYYLMVQNWGAPDGQGWGSWPARWFTRVRLARTVYQVWKRYTEASNRSKHVDTTGWVGRVKGWRFEPVEEELSPVERWERWQGLDDGESES